MKVSPRPQKTSQLQEGTIQVLALGEVGDVTPSWSTLEVGQLAPGEVLGVLPWLEKRPSRFSFRVQSKTLTALFLPAADITTMLGWGSVTIFQYPSFTWSYRTWAISLGAEIWDISWYINCQPTCHINRGFANQESCQLSEWTTCVQRRQQRHLVSSRKWNGSGFFAEPIPYLALLKV